MSSIHITELNDEPLGTPPLSTDHPLSVSGTFDTTGTREDQPQTRSPRATATTVQVQCRVVGGNGGKADVVKNAVIHAAEFTWDVEFSDDTTDPTGLGSAPTGSRLTLVAELLDSTGVILDQESVAVIFTDKPPTS
jgi:hypothetical protein